MSEVTFKSRVKQFWDWYSECASRFYETIEDRRCGDLADEVSQKMADLFPHFVWVFGPGPDEVGGHSFTISGNGVLDFQFLTEYWLAQAPEIEGWTFYCSRQPGDIHAGGEFRFDETSIAFEDTSFTATLDEENERVNIILRNPSFAKLNDNDLRMTAAFVVLDEILGEYGTGQWIGEIKAVETSSDDAQPVLQLRDFLHDLEIKYQWQKLPPTETSTLYQFQPSSEPSTARRGDILFGSTCNFGIVKEFCNCDGDLPDPLAGFGADFVYVEFSSSVLPDGREVDFRADIADEIGDLLKSAKIGRHIGGAFGAINSYIDFLLFDTQAGLEVIRSEMMKRNLPDGVAIHFFAKDKIDRSIVL